MPPTPSQSGGGGGKEDSQGTPTPGVIGPVLLWRCSRAPKHGGSSCPPTKSRKAGGGGTLESPETMPLTPSQSGGGRGRGDSQGTPTPGAIGPASPRCCSRTRLPVVTVFNRWCPGSSERRPSWSAEDPGKARLSTPRPAEQGDRGPPTGSPTHSDGRRHCLLKNNGGAYRKSPIRCRFPTAPAIVSLVHHVGRTDSP